MPERFPKLHNAAWPGVVGKDPDTDQKPILLDQMLSLTAEAKVNGAKFDGVDLFLSAPHTDIDSTDDDLKALADQIGRYGLVAGTVVAPVWPPTGGGSAMGDAQEQERFLTQVRKACQLSSRLRELGIRPYGNVRIDSAGGPTDWLTDPAAKQQAIANTFNQAADIAADHGEVLCAEGEICWGGMHSWKHMLDLLERVNRPEVLGFQADMAHTLLYTMGYNAPEHRLLPEDFAWNDEATLDAAYRQVADALRPWTNDFHVAQNDATVHGSGSHDKTGRHCQANDENGKLDIVKHAGFWLRHETGELTQACRHICWDGCMFPNDVMLKPQTWQDILEAMVNVQDAHGWDE
jgi:sugar phosphate isomerase/epimerase